jgi:hypothetical protein
MVYRRAGTHNTAIILRKIRPSGSMLNAIEYLPISNKVNFITVPFINKSSIIITLNRKNMLMLSRKKLLILLSSFVKKGATRLIIPRSIVEIIKKFKGAGLLII